MDPKIHFKIDLWMFSALLCQIGLNIIINVIHMNAAFYKIVEYYFFMFTNYCFHGDHVEVPPLEGLILIYKEQNCLAPPKSNPKKSNFLL